MPDILDPFRLKVETLRGDLTALTTFDHRARHSMHVAAILATAPPRQTSSGELDITVTTLDPVDEDVGAVLLFAALLGVKQTKPQVFAKLMRRLGVSP